jgi:hypothetical protein
LNIPNIVYQQLLKRTGIKAFIYDLEGNRDGEDINSKFTFDYITDPYKASDSYNLKEYLTLGYTLYPTKYIQIPVIYK